MPSGRIPHTAGTMQCEPSCLVCCPRASFTRRAPWPYAFLIPIQPPVKLPCLLLTLTHCRCRWPTWRNRDHHPLCHPCRRIGRCPPPTSPHSLYGHRSSTRRHRGSTGLFPPPRHRPPPPPPHTSPSPP